MVGNSWEEVGGAGEIEAVKTVTITRNGIWDMSVCTCMTICSCILYTSDIWNVSIPEPRRAMQRRLGATMTSRGNNHRHVPGMGDNANA